jgi:transcriptional antiterminator NusG
MEKKWYVVHTYSGYENKVKQSLEERLQSQNLQEKVSRILIPTEDVIEIKGGKKRVSARKYFPGYIMVEMEMDDDLWYLIKNTPRVTGFLGGKKDPTPLLEEEVKALLQRVEGESTKPKPKVQFQQGESVRVIDGPFTNFTGVVDEISPERGKVKVMVSIFGRATPVELEFLQVEKI